VRREVRSRAQAPFKGLARYRSGHTDKRPCAFTELVRLPFVLTPDDVHERLGFARERIGDLVALNGGDLLGADPHERNTAIVLI
jgi:hypothetical protein